MILPSGAVRPRPGASDWQPVLLKVPARLSRTISGWSPLLWRKWRLTTFTFLATFLVLQFLIPARMVISGMGAAGRPSAAVGCLLGFLWLVSAFRPRGLPRGSQPVRWVVGLFVGVQLLGHVVGFDRLPSPVEASAGTRWLIFVMSIAGVTLAVADGVVSRAALDRLLRTMVVLASMMSMVGILQYLRIVDLTSYIRLPGVQLNSDLIGVSSRGSEDFARVAGTATHYIEYGVVLALILPVALHYAFFASPGGAKVWSWLLAGTVAFGIPLSISRSATLTLVVVLFLLAVVWPWRLRYNALVIGVMGVVAFRAINPGVLGTIRALFANAENDTSVTDRIARTSYVIDLWQERPWLGRGAGMVIPEEYILLDNQWYMTLLDGGVLGVLAMALFFLVPYFMARSIRLRGLDEETRHLGQALAVTIPAAIMSAGTFDSFSFTTWVGVMSVLIGAIGALWRLDGTTVTRPLQLGVPSDSYVTTPLFAQARRRIRGAWSAAELRSRSSATTPSDGRGDS
ncbi:O-antigen ligase domain-containing protein [Nocardioides seonyuensis]|uniref:O-antigen ligase domain-containing protein n=1 Tax=Nocardioides seonyuensis TaxID=2518371 RepID=A0A4P7ID88_9ACTN|nr:O-antigen ligase family protein [Nocardioides seonyuensis]QBX54630.1 O-antigen ligase domain-containing protein [Nocardioides seonyuensis]